METTTSDQETITVCGIEFRRGDTDGLTGAIERWEIPQANGVKLWITRYRYGFSSFLAIAGESCSMNLHGHGDTYEAALIDLAPNLANTASLAERAAAVIARFAR